MGTITGRVVNVNPDKGLMAVETSSGVTVLELLGPFEIEEGDCISGNLHSDETEICMNLTRSESLDIRVESTSCSESCVIRLMS